MNKLVDEYNNTHHHSIDKKPIGAGYSVLTEEIETNPKSPKFKVGDTVRITKYNNILQKATPEIHQEKYLRLILC